VKNVKNIPGKLIKMFPIKIINYEAFQIKLRDDLGSLEGIYQFNEMGKVKIKRILRCDLGRWGEEEMFVRWKVRGK
jgi:hypothetical protein